MDLHFLSQTGPCHHQPMSISSYVYILIVPYRVLIGYEPCVLGQAGLVPLPATQGGHPGQVPLPCTCGQ